MKNLKNKLDIGWIGCSVALLICMHNTINAAGNAASTSNMTTLIGKPEVDNTVIVKKAVEMLKERDSFLEEAIEHYNRKEWISAIDKLRLVLEQTPEHETAQKYMNRIKKEMLNRVENWRGMTNVELSGAQGILAYINGEWKDAIDLLEKGKILDPGYDEQLEIGIVHSKRNLAKDREQIKEDQVGRLILEAKEQLARKEYQQALDLCNEVRALVPENMEVLGMAAQAKVALAKIEEQKRQEDILKYITIAIDLYTEDRYQESLRTWQKVLALDPRNQSALEYVARCKEKLSAMVQETENTAAPQSWKARQDAQQNSGDEPDFTKGLRYLEHEMYPEAIAEFERLLKAKPDFDAANNALAEAKAKQNEAAERYYKEALLIYSQGDRSNAIKTWAIVLKINPAHEKARQAIIKARAELEGVTQFQ